MTAFTDLLAPDDGAAAGRIQLVAASAAADFRAAQSELGRLAIDTAGFVGAADSAVFVPGPQAGDWALAVGTGADATPGRWTLAVAAARLPAGRYRVEGAVPAVALHGWLLAQHEFRRYRQAAPAPGARQLLLKTPAAIAAAVAEAEATALLRDLIDTPADDMGPAEVEAAIRDLAAAYGGQVQATIGAALLDSNFPAVHAVGRASPRLPRVVSMDWGKPGDPCIAIVGKGVCFDTGGLNLKPGNSMALMKKDMGGAAHAIALARLIMASGLRVRLRLVVATVDNAVAGNALRPGDVIATRKGFHVEIGNTDAEGRLILADALCHASEAAPALIVDFATLTGAARVALGPDLPVMFATDDDLAARVAAAGAAVGDEVWRLPLWRPYRRLFKSPIADFNNVSDSGFAGAIIAALFLDRFVPEGTPWLHFDIYGWNPEKAPGRPKGAAARALFAVHRAIAERFA